MNSGPNFGMPIRCPVAYQRHRKASIRKTIAIARRTFFIRVFSRLRKTSAMPLVVRCEPSRMVAVLALLLSLIGSPMPGALPLGSQPTSANLHRMASPGYQPFGSLGGPEDADRPTGAVGPAFEHARGLR